MSFKKSCLLAMISVGLVSIALGLGVQYQKMRSYEAARKTAFYENAVSLGVLVEKHLVEAIEISKAMRAVLNQFPDIGADRYQAIATELRRNRDHILNIAFAPDMVVKYVHPLEGNGAVLGFDMRTRPEQWNAAQTAARVGRPVVAGPVSLIQGGYGFIVRVPIYKGEGRAEDNLWGFLSTVISTQPLTKLLDDVFLAGAEVAIRGDYGLGVSSSLIMGSANVFDDDPVLYDVNLPYGHWQIGIRSTTPWNQLPSSVVYKLWGSIFVIAAFGTLIFVMILRFQNRQVRAEQDLAAAIDSIEDGFAMFDPEDNLTLCNTRYADLYDLPERLQQPGTPFEDILKFGLDRGQYPEARGRELDWLEERVALHRNPTHSFNQLFSDGRWVKVAESKTSSGSIVGFRVDITDLKNAQEAAERANQIKSQFLNNINHEMRTPLTVMLGYAPMLSDIRRLPVFDKLASLVSAADNHREVIPLLDQLVDEVAKLSSKMQNSGNHLLNLINDTLDLSKFEAGEMKLDLKPVHLAPLVNALTEEFALKLEGKELVMKSADTDFVVMADEMRLRQILTNLIGNAIKFTDEGLILISAKVQGSELEITVSDTGCGIPSRHLPKIFDEFFQGDASTTRKYGGTGLGLAISRDLAVLQSGRLKADSVEGVGSRFSITLPRTHEVCIDPPFSRSRSAIGSALTSADILSPQHIPAD